MPKDTDFDLTWVLVVGIVAIAYVVSAALEKPKPAKTPYEVCADINTFWHASAREECFNAINREPKKHD